jgi:hypothetical protein
MPVEVRFAAKFSLGLFSIGTLLLLIFCSTRSPTAAFIGYMYTAMASVVALIYLLVLLYDIFRIKVSVATGLQCALVVLLNIAP